MDEEDAFINLASMLEVSLVEDTGSAVSLPIQEAGDRSEKGDNISSEDIVNVNGIATSDSDSPSKRDSADAPVAPNSDVTCPTFSISDNDLQCPTFGASDSTYVPCSNVDTPANVHINDVSRVRESSPASDSEGGNLVGFSVDGVGLSKFYSSTSYSEEEKSVYKRVFQVINRVMYMRLHCTVCDCHIGCADDAAFFIHRYLRVLICQECESFYGTGDFPCGEDGSEMFCRWCGQGGNLLCCNHCPSVFCKKCMRRNLGRKATQAIEAGNEWTCFMCDSRAIWEHRALCLGLSNFLKEQSQFPADEKIPPEVAEKCPGFNAELCCKGEKPAFHRADQPLRHLSLPVLKVKNLQSLTETNTDSSLLKTALHSSENIPSSITSSIGKTYNGVNPQIPVSSVQNSLTSPNFITCQAPSNENIAEHLTTITTPSNVSKTYNVSLLGTRPPGRKSPVLPGDGVTNSTTHVYRKSPGFSFESAFVRHITNTFNQNQRVQVPQQNRLPLQNSTLSKSPVVTFTNAAAPNLNPSVSSHVRFVTIPAPPRPTVPDNVPSSYSAMNKIVVGSKLNTNNLIYTVSGSNMGIAQKVQPIVTTPLPPPGTTTRYFILDGGLSQPPKLVPISSVTGPTRFVHNQIIRPHNPNPIISRPSLGENAPRESSVKNTIDLSIDDDDGDGDENDVVEVFSTVTNSTGEKKDVTCEWMFKALKEADRTSRILAVHIDILRRKFLNEVNKKDTRPKGLRHLARKLFHLLEKASLKINCNKELVAKEFSSWLNAERVKYGIPIAEEGNEESSNAKVVPVNAESKPETDQKESEDLLLDMEISCESDHEDDPSLSNQPDEPAVDPDSNIKQELIECNEDLSSNENSFEDPFVDSENNFKEKLPAFKPFYSRTVREILRLDYSRKVLFQLLAESLDRSSEKKENKDEIPDTTEKLLHIHSVSTQTENCVEEDKPVKKTNQAWSGAFTDFLACKIKQNCTSSQSDSSTNNSLNSLNEIDPENENVSDTETTSIDPKRKFTQNTRSIISSDRIEDSTYESGVEDAEGTIPEKEVHNKCKKSCNPVAKRKNESHLNPDNVNSSSLDGNRCSSPPAKKFCLSSETPTDSNENNSHGRSSPSAKKSCSSPPAKKLCLSSETPTDSNENNSHGRSSPSAKKSCSSPPAKLCLSSESSTDSNENNSHGCSSPSAKKRCRSPPAKKLCLSSEAPTDANDNNSHECSSPSAKKSCSSAPAMKICLSSESPTDANENNSPGRSSPSAKKFRSRRLQVDKNKKSSSGNKDDSRTKSQSSKLAVDKQEHLSDSDRCSSSSTKKQQQSSELPNSTHGNNLDASKCSSPVIKVEYHSEDENDATSGSNKSPDKKRSPANASQTTPKKTRMNGPNFEASSSSSSSSSSKMLPCVKLERLDLGGQVPIVDLTGSTVSVLKKKTKPCSVKIERLDKPH